MFKFWPALSAIVLAMASVAHAAPITELMGKEGGKRTLVLLDNMATKNTHSIFFSSLESRGHQLHFHHAESTSFSLRDFGEYQYDNIIMMAPSAKDLAKASSAELAAFMDNGGNIMLTVDENMSKTMREFAEDLGVEFDAAGTKVIDHFTFEPSLDTSRAHTAVLTAALAPVPAVLGSLATSPEPVLFDGIGQSVGADNILALPVLRGESTTVSARPLAPITAFPENAGADTVLVSAVQGRNNARAIIAGSMHMCSNAAMNVKVTSPRVSTAHGSTGNRRFCEEISKWAMAEKAVLRYSDVTHMKSDGTAPDVMLHEKDRPDQPVSLYPDPEITRNSLVYRIKDEVVFGFNLEQLQDGAWVPYTADDVQLDLVMLDPYIRQTLTRVSDSPGRYSATLTLPDTYGIFKFRVMYRRPGLSTVTISRQVAVRPFKHDEYERFIASAYPYYASAMSMMAAFVVFSLAFLFTKE